MTDMTAFEEKLNKYVSEFNAFAVSETERFFAISEVSFGSSLMSEAMTYSLMNSGKRIRPVICLEFCRLCSGDYKSALPFALAIEMVHTYSLIHDDLPCMDDDDMRRGRPSNHKVYGYANALLAGDALLTLAFEEIASSSLDSDKKIKAVAALSGAAGYRGMVAGQVMDLRNESIKADMDNVRFTDELKTGEMIKVSAVLGCIAAGESGAKLEAAIEYCKNIGLAFQIVDDILDVTGSTETLGKEVGSDEKSGKSTYVSLLGVEKAEALANELTQKAVSALEVFGEEGGFLRQLAFNLSERKN